MNAVQLTPSRGRESQISYPILKGTADRLVALAALVLLSPLLLLLVLLIRLRLGSPVFFRQRRAGYLGQPFWLYKFRSMTNQRDSSGALLSDAERLKPFGQFLRASSLDELPELINILRGEMSFVGPRPLLMQYLPLYSTQQARRHLVRPGISGWAQVNGRNAISWQRKFELDTWYVRHRSLVLDLRILMLTAWKVIRREGISAEGWAVMPYFTGNGDQRHGGEGPDS